MNSQRGQYRKEMLKNLLAVRVNTVDNRTLNCTVLLASRLLRLGLEKRVGVRHWIIIFWHFLTWDGPGVCFTPNLARWTPLFSAAWNEGIDLKSNMKVAWKSNLMMKGGIETNLNCHFLFLSWLKPGNSLLFFSIFLCLLRLHLLHNLLKLLLRCVVRTQQLRLLFKLENLKTFFFWGFFVLKVCWCNFT